MKPKNKISVITIIMFVVTIAIIITGIIVANIVDEKRTIQKNIELIKYNYNQLTNDISEYNQIRTDLLTKLDNFIYENYSEEHTEYVELLTKYNENIKRIDSSVKNINDRCNIIYSDKTINVICRSYQNIYEKMVNLYVADLTNYNNKVTGYNEYKNETIELFEMIHKEYIDYNQDNKYEGKEVQNEANNEEK